VAGEWWSALALDPASSLPKFQQISAAVIDGVRSGRLRPGDSLPGSRTLARTFGVHRNTVLAAYAELAEQGWVVARAARATYIAPRLPGRAMWLPARTSGHRPGACFDVAPPISYDVAPEYRHGMLVLTKGAPDPRLLPGVELGRAYQRVLARQSERLLSYGDPRGHPTLRIALAEMLRNARGMPVEPDDLLVTHGSQHALDLIARSVIHRGDVVAVEGLGHPHVRAVFRLAGARLVAVPVDNDGLSVTALEELAAATPVRAVVVTPHHQFPSTVVMPAARRLRLLDVAHRHGMAVIEDDYDHEFHYQGEPVLPLASADRVGVVVYVGTLSKVLAPGLRLGFVAAPRPVIDLLASVRAVTDIQGQLPLECAIAELFGTGELARHVRRMRRVYHRRRDALLEALRCELGDALAVTPPSGGMALWAVVPADVDIEAWAGAAPAHGVAFRGGRVYDFAGQYVGAARLGFTCHDEAELAQAASRMRTALADTRQGVGRQRRSA
jgi:GntR family transcriptional regulator/MocR family aminotransferase